MHAAHGLLSFFPLSAAPRRNSTVPQRTRPPQNSTTRSSRVPTRTNYAAWEVRFQNTFLMDVHSTRFSGTHSVKTYSGCTEKAISR